MIYTENTPNPNAVKFVSELTFSEIGTLDITADIVILSACNTGGAQTNNSNAFSGLAASFIASGAKKLLSKY